MLVKTTRGHQMAKKFNPPVSIQIYLGSGKRGQRLRDNLRDLVQENGSLSEVVVNLLKKANPSLFKGLEDSKTEAQQ